MIKKISLYECSFYFLLLLIPIIDCITGYFLLENKNIGSLIGQIFRIITLVFLFFSILNKGKVKEIFVIFLFCAVLFLIPTFNYIRTSSDRGFIDEVIYATKLLLPMLMILGINNAQKNKWINNKFIDNIFSFYTIFVPLSLIIPKILGIGYATYENFDVGYKGFYYAGNELNILLLSISVLSFQKMMRKFTIFDCIVTMICLGSLFLVGTKTSFLVIIFLIFYNLVKKKNLKNKLKSCVIIFLILVVAYGSISTIFETQINKIVSRNQYYYETLTKSNNSIANYIFSNRNMRIPLNFKKNYSNNLEDDLIFKMMFGVGHYQQFKSTDVSSIIEMDFFDTILWYGVPIAFTIFIFYSYVLYRGIRSKKNKDYLLSYCLIFLFSIMAGHVWYSALAGSILGMVGSKLLE